MSRLDSKSQSCSCEQTFRERGGEAYDGGPGVEEDDLDSTESNASESLRARLASSASNDTPFGTRK